MSLELYVDNMNTAFIHMDSVCVLFRCNSSVVEYCSFAEPRCLPFAVVVALASFDGGCNEKEKRRRCSAVASFDGGGCPCSAGGGCPCLLLVGGVCLRGLPLLCLVVGGCRGSFH